MFIRLVCVFLTLASASALKNAFLKRLVSHTFLAGALCVSPMFPLPALADGGVKSFRDPQHAFSIQYPAGWTESSGALSGDRSVEAFVSPKDASTSVSIVYTPIPADFAKLSSFGDLQGYLIPKGEGVESKVLSERTKGDKITLEYVTSAPENPERHVITVFALRPAEAVIGVTAQAQEQNFAEAKADLTSIVDSFKY
jgi:hypothetical protein